MTDDEAKGCCGCVTLLALAALALAFDLVINYGGQEDIAGTVQSTYVKRKGGSDRFFVVLKDEAGREHVLTNRDTVWWWKWDSADEQGRLLPGKHVRVHVVGYRWGFLSWFPNVVRVDDVPAR